MTNPSAPMGEQCERCESPAMISFKRENNYVIHSCWDHLFRVKRLLELDGMWCDQFDLQLAYLITGRESSIKAKEKSK